MDNEETSIILFGGDTADVDCANFFQFNLERLYHDLEISQESGDEHLILRIKVPKGSTQSKTIEVTCFSLCEKIFYERGCFIPYTVEIEDAE